MKYIDFIEQIHTKTKRDYLGRVNEASKAECAKIAKKFERDFWDGERKFGYGGYKYDGRWESMAKNLVAYYKLKPGDSVLDIGCGKGYLLYELTRVIPDLKICGVDISKYALEHAKEEVKPYLHLENANDLSFAKKSFDLVISINTLHNLYIYDLIKAIKDIANISRNNSYIVVESYRTEEEKVNMMYWQLTCECFFKVEEWEWIYKEAGYTGDYGFIFFD